MLRNLDQITAEEKKAFIEKFYPYAKRIHIGFEFGVLMTCYWDEGKFAALCNKNPASVSEIDWITALGFDIRGYKGG